MEQLQWLLHMDERWMWRWFLTNDCGKTLAMSKTCFFRREDALENRDAARLVITGV